MNSEPVLPRRDELAACPRCGERHLALEPCRPAKALERAPADKMIRGGRTLTKTGG